MDVTQFLDIRPAPAVLFDAATERGDSPRFMVAGPDERFSPISWRTFANMTARCALWLHEQGVGRGDFVAIFADNSVQWMAAALGAQTCGAAMVPIYGNSTAEQVAHVLGHSEAKVLFVQDGAKATVADDAMAQLDSRPTTVTLDGDPQRLDDSRPTWQSISARPVEHDTIDALLADLDLHQHAVMLYTSGTSGLPKGVPLTHHNVGANGRDWLLCNGPLVEEGDVDLLWLPMSHIFGFGQACLGNTLGFTSYLCSPLTVLQHMPAVRPHIFMSVPAYLEKIATLARADGRPDGVALASLTGGRVRFCLSGGAGLKVAIKEFFHEHGILVIEGYGLTEASPTLTLNRPDAFDFTTVGQPLPSVELRLAFDGEIQARGDNIFAGYHKDPEATQAAFTADRWLKTGDLGELTDDGFLRIVGRKKEILVTAGGKNVPPANIETRFADNPLIEHVVVYGDGERYLVAGVWLNPLQARKIGVSAGSSHAQTALDHAVQAAIDDVNAQLPSYQTIKKHIVFPGALSVDNGLLTPTLKVRRNEVYKAFGPRLSALYGAR